MYIDIQDGTDKANNTSYRVCLNANKADKLTVHALGDDGIGADLNTLFRYDEAVKYRLSSNAAHSNLPSSISATSSVGVDSYPISSSRYGQEITVNNKKFFRTSDSGGTTWKDWQAVLSSTVGTAIGSANQPIYINASGVPTAGNSFIDFFTKGVSIPAESDLDTYNTPGKYFCGSTSNSSTLINSPVTNDNFALFVFARTSSNTTSLQQMIITLNGAFYLRGCASDGSWRAWNQFVDSDDINKFITGYLPLSAGEDYKITGPLGLTEGVMYGTTLPSTGFDGQLFFLAEDAEDPPIYVPEGGSTGQVLKKNSAVSGDISWDYPLPAGGEAGHVLIKNSSTSNDASWKELVALPKGGTSGQVLVKNSTTDGDASWSTNISGNAATSTDATNAKNIYSSASTSKAYVLGTTTASSANHATVYNASVYTSGSVLYGAAWNDYAEYRTQKENIEPGYCVASADNGQVYKTTEKFQACDGIVSDTFGFAIGETEECKTPLAVAGRVLAYCEGDRNDYHSGDTVCAGPEGKVCKMTREEIREWPDRIIGIVSEIPGYETWGSGNVPVNGRIWIKVK